MTDNRVLVTGGSGFVGTNLVHALVARGCSVLNLDMRPAQDPILEYLRCSADLRDEEQVLDAFKRFEPSSVVHLGARTDFGGTRVRDYAANTTGVSNVCSAAQVVGPEKVVFASSRLVNNIHHTPISPYEYSPPNAYGLSKVIGEQIVRDANLKSSWIIVRPTSIWGPWFGVPYRNFFDHILRGTYLHPRGEVVRKSFGFVGNAVHQLLALLDRDLRHVDRNQIYYLADYEPLELKEFAEDVARHASLPRGVRHVPSTVLQSMATIGDFCKLAGVTEPPLTTFRLDNLRTSMIYDLSPMQELVGELPVDRGEGISQTLSWMKTQDG